MPNAKDLEVTPYHKILVVGSPGAGKSTQIYSLPGKKFAYFFDPNAALAVRGLDIDYEEFLPSAEEIDATLKGFNKGSKSDKPFGKTREPTAYFRWERDFNDRVTSGFFASYDWLILDSLTSLVNIMFDRVLYLNNRYGEVEEMSDLKIVGAKLSDVFRSVLSEDMNIFCTGHLNTYQDEKTSRITTQLNVPGRARRQLPLLFSSILELRSGHESKPNRYVALTRAEPRGFSDVRCSVQGLDPVIDITIEDPKAPKTPLARIKDPQKQGLGAVLRPTMPPLKAERGAGMVVQELSQAESPPTEAQSAPTGELSLSQKLAAIKAEQQAASGVAAKAVDKPNA